MKDFTSQFQTASAPTFKPVNNGSLIGLSLNQVVAACQHKLMSGRGANRKATGNTFLNMVLPRISVAHERGVYDVPNLVANLNNTEGGLAAQLAEHLSTELLGTGTIPSYKYFFKLIDSNTKEEIYSDHPGYEENEEAEEVPDFVKAAYAKVEATEPESSAYEPDPNHCAWLHIYIEQNGVPVHIASNDIEAKYAKDVAAIQILMSDGAVPRAVVRPQRKVAAWLASLENNKVDPVAAEIAGFTQA